MLKRLAELSDPWRIAVLIMATAALIFFGFKREKKLLIFEQGTFMFINRYPKPEVAKFEKSEMKGTLGVKLPAKLQSSVLFSFLYLVIAGVLLLVYSRSVFIGKLMFILYFLYMIICFILLKLGDFGVDYRLSTGLSHYIEDLFLSPFLILAIAALVKAFGFVKKPNPEGTFNV
ncbi:MAG: hypothetical protein JNL88_12395 [Bacteroidia bacterium]|nr:hypothetical protein [Bacteroidia bacterium]